MDFLRSRFVTIIMFIYLMILSSNMYGCLPTIVILYIFPSILLYFSSVLSCNVANLHHLFLFIYVINSLSFTVSLFSLKSKNFIVIVSLKHNLFFCTYRFTGQLDFLIGYSLLRFLYHVFLFDLFSI